MPNKGPTQPYRTTEREPRRGNLGVVTDVIERDGEAERFTNHEVNVQLIREDEELRNLPVHVTHMGHIRVPAVGDFVEVSYLTGKTQSAYVSDFAYSDKQRAPLGRAGHWRHRFGEDPPYLFLEAEPSDHQGVDKDFDSAVQANPPEIARLAVKEDGLSDPSVAMELDTSGSAPIASIRSNQNPSSNEHDELSMGINVNDETAYIRGNPNDDTTDELEVGVDNQGDKAYIEADVNGNTLEIVADRSTGEIDVNHGGTGSININNNNSGDINIVNNAGSTIVDGDTVTLGNGGTFLLKDVTVTTTTDADGHVTSVSLDKTRSSVAETE